MDMKELAYGVEIELVHITRERAARAIQSVVGGEVCHVGSPTAYDPWTVIQPDGRVWNVVKDGSLVDVPEHLRAEVVSPILDYGDMEQLQEVVRALRRARARTSVNTSIHIHVDGSTFDGPSLVRLAKLVYKQEPLILAALGVSPQRLARYAKPINPDFIAKLERHKPATREHINRLWYGRENLHPQRYDPSRYTGVNYSALYFHGTIEFRWFTFRDGKLHAGELRAYVSFVLALAVKALNARAASAKNKREFDPVSARFSFRVFLLRLGFIGATWKAVRHHLLKTMPGDSAWKHGRPKPKTKPKPEPATEPVEVKA